MLQLDVMLFFICFEPLMIISMWCLFYNVFYLIIQLTIIIMWLGWCMNTWEGIEDILVVCLYIIVFIILHLKDLSHSKVQNTGGKEGHPIIPKCWDKTSREMDFDEMGHPPSGVLGGRVLSWEN